MVGHHVNLGRTFQIKQTLVCLKLRQKAEIVTGGKVRRLRTDGAFDSVAWRSYLNGCGITHEPTAPYPSAQNGLAERAIRTMIDDVCTLLRDSGLGHSYWAEAAAYSIDTRNLIPSRRHPGHIPLESFTGKRQDISHLRVFGAKCSGCQWGCYMPVRELGSTLFSVVPVTPPSPPSFYLTYRPLSFIIVSPSFVFRPFLRYRSIPPLSCSEHQFSVLWLHYLTLTSLHSCGWTISLLSS